MAASRVCRTVSDSCARRFSKSVLLSRSRRTSSRIAARSLSSSRLSSARDPPSASSSRYRSLISFIRCSASSAFLRAYSASWDRR